LSVKKKKETYQNHRDNQRERILDTAERLFIQEGIDNVSISAIADAVRIARRTLYQYFPDKQEISWAI
jgi:AcrR family transcriptional regulator